MVRAKHKGMGGQSRKPLDLATKLKRQIYGPPNPPSPVTLRLAQRLRHRGQLTATVGIVILIEPG